jgi:cyclopropane fatty-acyl-phospholipid synthase-like methyltransferase
MDTHGGGSHDLTEELNKRLESKSAVLELGCGDGRDALYLAKSCHHVMA